MVNDRGLTYGEVADRYGVDPSAVALWIRKHDIAVAERIAADEIKARYAAGESANFIAQDLGCAKTTVLNVLRRAGIERRASGWRAPLISKSGCPVRSTYELRVADWLTERGVAFEYEPDVPFGHGNTRADFFVNGWYIEVWGVHSNARYSAQRKRKQRLYAEHNLPLIELSPHHFSRDRHIMEKRLRQTLKLP